MQIIPSWGGGIRYIKTTGFLGNFNKAREIVKKPYCMLFHDDDILHPNYLEFALKLLNKYSNTSLITTRYTEFFDNDVPNVFPEIKPKYYLFDKQKDFATHMFFIELIAYAPAIYRTKDFLRTEIEYDKFNKFNDWPFMVKISQCGNCILLDDKKIFYVRRHSGQDTWTYKNVPNFEQIVNWDKIFYDIFKKSKDKKLIEAYKYKSEYFLKGKYEAFIPPIYKNSTSYIDLLKQAKKMGLKDLCVNAKYLKKIESSYFEFIKTLKYKNLYYLGGGLKQLIYALKRWIKTR